MDATPNQVGVEIEYTGFTTGLSEPVIAGQLLDNQGAVTLARGVGTVIELPASSGRYIWTFNAPAAEGTYGAILDQNSGTIIPGVFASEPLIVATAGTASGGGGGTAVVPVIPIVVGPTPSPGTFYIKRGDTREPIAYQALEGTVPVDLADIQDIRFLMRAQPDEGFIIIDSPAIALPGLEGDGWMQYQWLSGDTDYAGTYDAEFEVTWNDGRIKTFPTTSDLTKEYITVRIPSDLDDPVGIPVGGTQGTGPPTTGDWLQGDVIRNSDPQAGGNYGWICIVSGTPGTWVTFGVIGLEP